MCGSWDDGKLMPLVEQGWWNGLSARRVRIKTDHVAFSSNDVSCPTKRHGRIV